MKASNVLAFSAAAGLASAGKARLPRQTLKEDLGIEDPLWEGSKDGNGLEVKDTCDADHFEGDEKMCGVTVTFSESGSISEAFQGRFGIETGKYLVHMFAGGECRWVDTAELTARGGGKGFEADIDDGRHVWWVGVSCFNTACGNDFIGKVELSWGGEYYDVWCDDREYEWTESGVGVRHYKFCTWKCM